MKSDLTALLAAARKDLEKRAADDLAHTSAAAAESTESMAGTVKKDTELDHLMENTPTGAKPPTDATQTNLLGDVASKDLKPSETPHADSANPSDNGALPNPDAPTVKTVNANFDSKIASIASRLNSQVKTAGKGPVAPPAPQAAPIAGTVPQVKTAADEDTPVVYLCKLAKAMLATEAGRADALRHIEAQDGAEAAERMIKAATDASFQLEDQTQVKEAAIRDTLSKAQNYFNFFTQSGIGESEAVEIYKTAALHEDFFHDVKNSHPMIKAAYAAGAAEAPAAESADDQGAPPDASMAGDDGLTDEEAKQVLEQMIAAGMITEDDVKKLLAGDDGSGAAPPPDGSAPPPGPDAGAPPPGPPAGAPPAA